VKIKVELPMKHNLPELPALLQRGNPPISLRDLHRV
jgi:hypothetical protein